MNKERRAIKTLEDLSRSERYVYEQVKHFDTRIAEQRIALLDTMYEMKVCNPLPEEWYQNILIYIGIRDGFELWGGDNGKEE